MTDTAAVDTEPTIDPSATERDDALAYLKDVRSEAQEYVRDHTCDDDCDTLLEGCAATGIDVRFAYFAGDRFGLPEGWVFFSGAVDSDQAHGDVCGASSVSPTDTDHDLALTLESLFDEAILDWHWSRA